MALMEELSIGNETQADSISSQEISDKLDENGMSAGATESTAGVTTMQQVTEVGADDRTSAVSNGAASQSERRRLDSDVLADDLDNVSLNDVDMDGDDGNDNYVRPVDNGTTTPTEQEPLASQQGGVSMSVTNEEDAAKENGKPAASTIGSNNDVGGGNDNSNKDTDCGVETDGADADHGKKLAPLEYARKAGVAVAGGTMVVVGAIMIPLPTPFGAVIAASGMGVLGTEFESARKVNGRVISKAKEHLEYARTKLADRIEETAQSMEEQLKKDDDVGVPAMDDDDSDDEGDDGAQKSIGTLETPTKSHDDTQDQQEKVADSSPLSVDTDTNTHTNSESDRQNAESSETNNIDATASSQEQQQAENVAAEGATTPTSTTSASTSTPDAATSPDGNEEAPPSWLYMSQSERKRQNRLIAERRLEEERQKRNTTMRNARQYLRKQAATFLSNTLLPMVRQKETESPASEEAKVDTGDDETTDSSKNSNNEPTQQEQARQEENEVVEEGIEIQLD
eukprot:CAMPEP_0119549386 /NCGR_PEP_ID=MMETSP1352-20130426/3088_1 /TAXON_ID=265584 /ORGANISM="Stauroneis constricta, Strain CCMP1120" /LENGTH=511 /DNA_ID=CAMNT_0007594919 /DNA_START=129 /DNA_END=1664 /DNA_ORIENTATION=+